MNTTSPVAEPKPSATLAPRLLDQVVSNAEQNGHSHDAAVSMADWCRRYVLFHGKRHPSELGLMEIGAFLRHVADTEKDPLPRIELARDSLDFLYRQVLHIAVPDLPLPRPPRLLDQVRQVTRVRHYSRRTEDCYVQWATRFIFFHKKRHPRDMSAAFRPPDTSRTVPPPLGRRARTASKLPSSIPRTSRYKNRIALSA